MNTFKELLSLIIPTVKRHSYHMLFDFTLPATVNTFRYGTDSYYGGSSTCTFEFNKQNGCVIFKGNLSTKMPKKTEISQGNFISTNKRILRTGFAAFIGDLNWIKRLGVMREFNAVEIIAKGDNKVYNLNIKPESFSNDDLYQQKLIFSNIYTKKIIKFENMLLTGYGRVKGIQRTFDHGAIRSIGMSIADKQEGEFKLDIKSIALLNTDLIKHNNNSNSL